MGAKSTAPAVALLVGALTLGVLTMGALAVENCPKGCTCDKNVQLDMYCKLSKNSSVAVKGKTGPEIEIICDTDGEAMFTFEEIPQIDYGQGTAIRLKLKDCHLPPTFSSAASRLGADYIQELYVQDAPTTVDITQETVEGLERLERLAIYSYEKYNASIPTEAFSKLPMLQRFTINYSKLVLRADDFYNAPNLVYLELSNCDITQLPDGVFSKLNKLKKLIMFRNSLEEVTEDQLRGLESLEEIELSGNKLQSVDALINVTRSLKKLAVSGNRLKELPVLSGIASLEEVIISSNDVPLKIPSKALASLANLNYVDLSFNNIESLPSDVFKESSAIRSIKFISNRLKELPVGLFEYQEFLENLTLDFNEIVRLDTSIFKKLRALKKLSLNNNNLTVLPPFLFSAQSALLSLNIAYNRLESISINNLSGAFKLVEVDLSHNRIGTQTRNPDQYYDFGGAFTQLKNLKILDLSHNNLTAVPEGLSSSGVFLTKLNLAYNQIESVTGAGYTSNQAIIDLSHNEIKTWYLDTLSTVATNQAQESRAILKINYNPFACDCLLHALAQRLHNYKPLDTSEAKFEADNAYCSSPPSLAGKLLQNVPFEDFICEFNDTACPDECSCLYRIHTKSYEFTCKQEPRIVTDTVQNLKLKLSESPPSFNLSSNVHTLNLSGLALQKIPPGSLPATLKVLDLSRNNLTEIPQQLYSYDLKLRIAENPLKCDCWNADAVKELQDNFWKIEDYKQVNCSRNIPISTINAQQLCSTWRASVIGGVLAMLGLITAIIAILILRYSLEIKVWLYNRGMFARWFVIDDDDRKYDAFISFCHRDDEFVSEHLIPGLEDIPQPYKLCIHYRDWMPGEFITTQIAQSVADSRRTIIVVSKNFLESQWARAEFRTANMTAIKERKTRVIAILLEDVNSHKELDPELKAYLSTNTYLKWGDPWFWDKLRYALPHRKADAVRRRRRREKPRCNETVALARADVAAKVVQANGLDTRLTADGVIINAASLTVPKENKISNQIQVDMTKLNNIRSVADMKPIQV